MSSTVECPGLNRHKLRLQKTVPEILIINFPHLIHLTCKVKFVQKAELECEQTTSIALQVNLCYED